MCDCRKELGSFSEVHLFPTNLEDRVQGMQAICDPSVEQKGHGRRTRKASGSMRIFGRLPRGVITVSITEGIGIYHRRKTWD
jgi:hypothetical protein